MRHLIRLNTLTLVLLITLVSVAQAGPPLICHPFQTAGSPLLPWGTGPGWNTPDRHYETQRLTADLLALLESDAPILDRMENMRRAAIYASRDDRTAAELLAAVVIRAKGGDPSRLAVFDAGYLLETFRQAQHLFGRTLTEQDGYAMVQRAIAMGPPIPEMEFAAALMTGGPTSAAHLTRARAAAGSGTLLAKNIAGLGW
jgi:hypothetical protein